MEETSLIVKIVIGLIILHLIGGFGFLMYKLSPRKEDGKKVDKE